MQQALLSYFLLVGIFNSVFPQGTEDNYKVIQLISGIENYHSSDRLLNYYSYSDFLFPVQLVALNKKDKNTYGLKADICWGEMKLDSEDKLYYEYNFIQHQEYELSLFYRRNIIDLYEKFSFQAGVTYDFGFVAQQENYKTYLYDFGNGYRRSYVIQVFALSPEVVLSYKPHRKHTFTLEASASCLSYNARPNDNYVKQYQIDDVGSEWQFYAGDNYLAFCSAVSYHVEIIRKLGLVLQYDYRYKKYSYTDECKYSRDLFLLGLEKKF